VLSAAWRVCRPLRDCQPSNAAMIDQLFNSSEKAPLMSW
jgi:hypothetical protein